MKKLLIVLMFTASAFAQTKAEQLAEINRHIWLPFIEGVNTDRPELYVGVHAKDFHWVAAGSKGRIMNLAEYDDDSRKVMKRRKDEGSRSEIEVRFLERNVHGGFAAEKCVVKFTLHRRDQAPEVSYGITHYFSRKENGVWRRWMQFKPDEKGSAELFASAAAMGDVGRF